MISWVACRIVKKKVWDGVGAASLRIRIGETEKLTQTGPLGASAAQICYMPPFLSPVRPSRHAVGSGLSGPRRTVGKVFIFDLNITLLLASMAG